MESIRPEFQGPSSPEPTSSQLPKDPTQALPKDSTQVLPKDETLAGPLPTLAQEPTLNLANPNETLVMEEEGMPQQLPENVTEVLAETKVQIKPKAIEKLGPYQILAEIGTGGMGKVYRAYHPQLDRVVAVKVMLHTGQLASRERSRFLSEAQLAAKLQHPNIVAVHDIGTDQGLDYIVMDYIEGDSLENILKRELPSPRRALEILEEVALAMEYAHQKGIIHRDLKPGNLLIEKATGKTLITDFGLAKNLEVETHLTHSGEALGTPKYMAPEQAMGDQSQISIRTDVYAMGAILYELLTGQQAVQGETTAKTIYGVLYEDVIPPRKHNPKLAAELNIICLKALSKEPTQRYTSAGALAEDIRRFLNGEMILARRPTVWYYAKRFLKHHRVAAILVGALTLLLTFAWYWNAYAQQQRLAEDLEVVRLNLQQIIAEEEVLRKEPHFQNEQEINLQLEERIKNLIQQYQALGISIDRILLAVPRDLTGRWYLYQTQRQVGFLAIRINNFLLAELAFERCKHLGFQEESNSLAQMLAEKKAMQKRKQNELRSQYLKEVQDMLNSEIAKQAQNYVRQFQESNYQLVALPTDLQLKEMVETYATASNLLEKLLELNPDQVHLKKQLHEVQFHIGLLAWIAKDFLFSQMALERCLRLEKQPKIQQILETMVQQRNDERTKKQKQIQECIQKADAMLQNPDFITAADFAEKQKSLDKHQLQEARRKSLMVYVEASAFLEQALALDPQNQEIKRKLYDVYHQMGILGLDASNDLLSWFAFMGCANLFPGSESDALLAEIDRRRTTIKNEEEERVQQIMQAVQSQPLSSGMLDESVTEIVRLGPANTVLPLLGYLESKSVGQRRIAIQALGKLGVQRMVFKGKDVVQWLITRLQNLDHARNLDETEDLIWALGRLKDPRAAELVYRIRFQIGQQQRNPGFWERTQIPALWLPQMQVEKASVAELAFQEANAYYSSSQWDLAIEKYSKVIAMDSHFALAYLKRGMAYSQKKEFQKAIQDFNLAIQENARDGQSYFHRGLARFQLQDREGALEDFSQAINLGLTQESMLYHNRGVIRHQKGDLQGAIEDYTAALNLNPQMAGTYSVRALAYQSKGNVAAAIQDLHKAIQCKPDFADFYKHRALLLARTGQHKQAVEDVKRYLQFNPDDPDVPQLLQYLQKYDGK